MKPLTSRNLNGTWATLLLPVNDDDSFNYALLEAELDLLVKSGVNGVYCNGSAGEFYNQTEEEFDIIAGMLAAKCAAAKIPFQIGVSHMSPIIALNRLLRTKKLQPGAFQLILPDWSPTTPPDRGAFLQKMADAAEGVGLVLYNPGVAKVTLTSDEIADLVNAVPQIIGIKGAWRQRTRTLCPDLSIFVPGHELATGIAEGASGSYSNVACLNPGAAQRWYELMLTDMDRALELEQRIQTFMTGYIAPYITDQGYADQALDKLLACIGGWLGMTTKLRWPYKSIPAADVERLRPIATELLPEFFEQHTPTAQG